MGKIKLQITPQKAKTVLIRGAITIGACSQTVTIQA
jgi:hypothetical protein